MESEFLRIAKTADLEEEYERVLRSEPDLEKELKGIQKYYWTAKTAYNKKCESTAQQLLMTILTDNELKEIHSARYRIKVINSLLSKYIRKKSLLPDKAGNDYDIEKYRPLNSDNYYKVITDLIGIRILIRYQQQWEDVHNWIWYNFHKSDKHYIKNWIDDYPVNDAEDFIVEKPKLYLRSMNELPLYQTLGKDVFEHHISKEGYSSIHYLLWYDKKYVEIQVRTIYDEAWGECTHDLVYKCKNKGKRAYLEELSECLAIQTQAAGMIADMMFDYSQDQIRRSTVSNTESGLSCDEEEKVFAKFEKRAHKMQKAEKVFDGSVDSLI